MKNNINKQYEKFTNKFFGIEYIPKEQENFNKTSRF
jgi:hypothetical protein